MTGKIIGMGGNAMIRAAVVEDDKNCREQILSFLARYSEEKEIPIETDAYTDGKEIAQSYTPRYDILFLDVEMPGMDGMKAARLIRERDSLVIIVFITNVARYAVKGYEVQALDFMLKPLKYEGFAFRLGRIVHTLRQREEKSILLNNGTEIVRVRASTILYVEVLRHQVAYHTSEGTITVRSSLKEAEQLLAGQNFEKCNTCYLVNLRHVRGIRDGSVLVGTETLQISRARKKGFIQAVSDYVGAV